MDKTIIDIKNLNFSYEKNLVLQDVNLAICEGALMSIVGPNGGGKSTLVKLLLGLLTPNSGSISIFGKDVHEANKYIGYVPQFTHYDPLFPITVSEVVLMGKLTKGLANFFTKKDFSEAERVLSLVNLSGFGERSLSSLSGGEQQRAFIARALISHPRLLLLDEPTSNIDTDTSKLFYELLKQLNKEMTILMVSHDLGVVANVVDKVICVNKVVAVHPVSAIASNTLHDIYGMPLNLVHHCCHDLQHEHKAL